MTACDLLTLRMADPAQSHGEQVTTTADGRFSIECAELERQETI